MRITVLILIVLLLMVGVATYAASQELSSSLYNTGGEYFADPFVAANRAQPEVAVPGRQTDERSLSPAVAAASFMAVRAPEPRTFAVHDLLTIIIREDTQTTFSSSLETEKDSGWTGEIAEIPRFSLSDMLDLKVVPNTFPDGTVKLDIAATSEFEGEGDYANKQSMTARIQATIIDVKPNGNVVVEARKSVRSDDEHFTLVATGVCRVDDITIDNTVLSTQLSDLFIDKQHDGHLKKAADKGLLTELVDFFFPW